MSMHIIYFSKDRPMQLDLALKTNQAHLKHATGSSFVIHKGSNQEYRKAYNQVSKENPLVTFIEEVNFKEDVLMAAAWSDYLMFVVDDTIFTADYDFYKIERALRNDLSSVGFSLRLGSNTTYCYPLDIKNDIPDFGRVHYGNICFANWKSVKVGDFGYPLELSSSIYQTSLISSILRYGDYNNPNELESLMDNAKKDFPSTLYFFEDSVAFSNPINKVQTINNNRVGNYGLYKPDILLKMYMGGFRIKNNFDGFIPNGCHQEVKFSFEYCGVEI